MTRKGIWWIVAGIGCLLLAVPPARAEGDNPAGDDNPAVRPGDEGERGKDGPRVREGQGPQGYDKAWPRISEWSGTDGREGQKDRDRQQGEHRDGDRVQIQMQGGGWVNLPGPRSEHPAPGQHGPEPMMTVIRLQHISAEAYMQAFKQLCHNPAVGEALSKVPVAMCEQANAIVVLGPPQAKAFFQELAAGLDQPSEFHERMHARQMEMRRQEAEMGQHFGPAGGPMRGGMRPGGGPMMGPGQMGPGHPGMGPMGKGPMGMGMGMGKNPMGPCPKCQGPMGPCPKCQGQMGVCPKCQGGQGVCPMCQGAMGGGKFNQPMPGGMPMPGQPMPGQPMPGGPMPGGGMMPGGMPMPGAPMPGGEMMPGGMPKPGTPTGPLPGQQMPGGMPGIQRPPMSDEDAVFERLRQRRQAEIQRATPGSPSAPPKEGHKPQAAQGGEGQPSESRMLDEALMDPGMPVVKRLLSPPLAERLHLDRKQVEKIEEAATAHRQNVDKLRDGMMSAVKNADPKDRQAVAQRIIPGAKMRIEQLTAELRGRIGEVLTGEQRDSLDRALRAGEGQGGDKFRGEPRREGPPMGPPRGEPGQTGPVETPQASPGGCGGGCGGCSMSQGL